MIILYYYIAILFILFYYYRLYLNEGNTLQSNQCDITTVKCYPRLN